ncbi:MAG: tetratricopeptide repeat protein [Planctomycetes bacterium]|nr:tetratricopeptide repeat protein [Planctomycetota bacterium]
MVKDCERFKADITDYARGESKYVKNMDALLTHLKECEACREKYFDLEAIFDGLKEAYYQPSSEFLKRMEEIKAMARKGPPPEKELTETQKKMRQGIGLYKAEKWFDAAKIFDELSKEEPKNSDVWYHLGLVHQKMNMTGEALVAFNKAIELNPNDADAYYHRSEVKYELAPWGDEDDVKAMLKETIKDLSQAIYLNPDYIEAYYGRAMVYDALGEFETAIDAFSELIDRDDKNHLAYFYRGMNYIYTRSLKQAQRDFLKVIELTPDSYSAYHNLGIAYALQGDFQKAAAEFKTALMINPEYQPAKETLQMAEEKLRMDKMREKIMEAISKVKVKDKKKGRTKETVTEKKLKDRVKELETENKMLKEFNQKLMATISGHGETAYKPEAMSQITPLPVFTKRESIIFSPKRL